MSKLPGLSRAEEEERLREVIEIAQRNLENVREEAKNLEELLHSMQQDFNIEDKEQQVLWHNADSRFREVRQEITRVGIARKKPYFGRIDYRDPVTGAEESHYIGRSVISRTPSQMEVIDWRAPIASVYYESALGMTTYSVKGEGKFQIDLMRKRTYEIENDRLKDFYDSDVVANDELLTKYLAKNKRAVLGEIIATIQQEQNEVIRKKPQHNMIIQGAAGSGKTTVAMHRISYILYNFELEFKPEDFYVIGSNQVLLNYITGVLPELNVYGVRQMTMEQLFVRLLYEDWNEKKYRVKPVIRGVTEPVKGTGEWFRALESFARDFEWSLIPQGDVVMEKNGTRLMSGDTVKSLLTRFDRLSRADKISLLSERILGKLENEISGKYYSYSAEEKKELRMYYKNYFGKREWKGSVFALYQEFLLRQTQAGIPVEIPRDAFDLYDLAALAFLYKRLRETEIIREAGHVVVDEAQDFGMMAYHCLKYCLSTCTYTIMGDISQNIYLDYGLNDWQELRALMLPNEFDYFGLLRKSYRNTVEISDFATGILQHGSFYTYPVQPILRHGEEVAVLFCEQENDLLRRTCDTVKAWQEKGFETIAVICPDEEQTEKVRVSLGERIKLLELGEGTTEFGRGVMVLTLALTKGLEFDAVLLYDCSDRNYPREDGAVKRLYVAATRALHELTVLYQGQLTGLIADPLTEEQKSRVITESANQARTPLPEEEDKTKEQIALETARLGEAEMAGRHFVGPKRIVIASRQMPKESGNSLEEDGITLEREAARDGDASDETPSVKKDEGKKTEVKKAQVKRAQVKKAQGNGKQAERKRVYTSAQSVVLPSYLEERLQQGITGKRMEERKNDPIIPAQVRAKEFGSMPEQKDLFVPGHGRIDCAVRMCMKGKDAIDLISSYGLLRLEPLAPDVIRVCFSRNPAEHFGPADERLKKGPEVFSQRETREGYEILTDRMKVRVSKSSGEVSFWRREKSGKGRDDLLLSEKVQLPRLIEKNAAYTFWDWTKKESLMAKPPAGELPLSIGQSARLISFGERSKELPGLHSDHGYEIWFPAAKKIMCCNISMYGNYLFQEGERIEYYFKIKSQV